MTPHVSGWMRGTQENRFQLIAENINRLAAGESLVNVIQGPKRHNICLIARLDFYVEPE